jgi:hypothetical protein
MIPTDPDQLLDHFHLVVFVFLAVGIVANGVLALVFFRKTKKRYSSYVRSEGVVAAITKVRNGDGVELIYPVVKFALGSLESEFKNPYGRSPWNIKPDDRVPVIYDPAKPETAEIEDRWVQYFVPLFFALGCLSAIFAIVAFLFYRRF